MRSGIAGASLLVLIALLAMANSPITKEEVVPGPIEGTDVDTCDVLGYSVYTLTDGRSIPDNTTSGLVSGPIHITDVGWPWDTIVDVKMNHTWIGDLIVKLYPDPECDGGQDNEADAIALLCRPDLVACPLGDCCGCSDDLQLTNNYRWSSQASQPMGEPCSYYGLVPSGCYHEAVESENLLSGIERRDGCWWLVISDCAGMDVGTLSSWTLYFLVAPGATEAATWGTVKTIFTE